MTVKVLIGLTLLFASVFTIIGIVSVWHVLRSQKYPADKTNRINKIRLWWFALSKEEKFVGFFPWLRRNEWDNFISTAPIGEAKDMYTVINQILLNYHAKFSHEYQQGLMVTTAVLDNVSISMKTSPRLIDESQPGQFSEPDPSYVPPEIYEKNQFQIFVLRTPEEFKQVKPIRSRFKTFTDEFEYLLHEKAVEFRIQKMDHGFNILFETTEDAETRLADHTSHHVFEFTTRWLNDVMKLQTGSNDRDIEHETVELLLVLHDGLGHRSFYILSQVFPKHNGDYESGRMRFEFSGLIQKLQ